MEFRALNSLDSDQVAELCVNVNSLFKSEFDVQEGSIPGLRILQSLSRSNDDSNRIVTFGAFNSGKLVGLLSAYRWSNMPYYSIRDLKSWNPTRSVRNYIHMFDGLTSSLLKAMESEGRFDFFFVNYQRTFHRKAFFERAEQKSIPRYFGYIRNYELSVEDVIPPGQKSRWPTFQELTFHNTFNVPVWIRRGSLKNEIRNLYWKNQI